MMINHTIPIVKSPSSNYRSHSTPIAPAPPNLAPKPTTINPPVHVLPKPIEPQLQNKSFQDRLETQSLPCVLTSKQWVLPPRPKAGRKPALKKKKNQQDKQNVPIPLPQSNISKLSSNLTSLNLYKSQSENVNLNGGGNKDDDLKNQLDTATEENQKLKNIILRLKKEIESLQSGQPMPQQNIQPSIPDVSTPINSIGNLTSREVSPTIDPKNIQQEHLIKKPKRQYRKKKKPEDVTKTIENKTKNKKQELPTPMETPVIDNTPSPLSNVFENEVGSNLPNLESIIEQVSVDLSPFELSPPSSNTNQFKKSKTLKLERSMSLQPEQISSGFSSSQFFKSIGLDRTMSIPMEFFENTPTSSNILSRTTTNTSFFDECKRCGNDSCLCLESGHIDDLRREKDTSNEFNSNVNNVNNNEENEFDVNFFIKSEFDEDHDEFLMI